MRLSKSPIQSGRKCHKHLWLQLHEHGAVQWDGTTQARLNEGTAFDAPPPLTQLSENQPQRGIRTHTRAFTR